MDKYVIYVDGAYSSSRNMMGYAFVVLKNGEKVYSYFMNEKDGTNNRAEVRAAIEACKWAVGEGYDEITVYSDSMYVIGTMTQNWKRKKNVDLWIAMDDIAEKIKVNWIHVKGHNGDRYNELCDVLATQASQVVD